MTDADRTRAVPCALCGKPSIIIVNGVGFCIDDMDAGFASVRLTIDAMTQQIGVRLSSADLTPEQIEEELRAAGESGMDKALRRLIDEETGDD